MRVLNDGTPVPEVVHARAVELFARWVRIVAPMFFTLELAKGLGELAVTVAISALSPRTVRNGRVDSACDSCFSAGDTEHLSASRR
ncbi:hypothetical protein FHX48_001453 [Microbacterium halimionae]|uniref:Uncharacterized protein n=1 Tax=Microbacterium halimionae TaxID=1526413 RepID=A0A7W3JP28_9MICO|nr:hypothetical protein [Microbacterium halimionae]